MDFCHNFYTSQFAFAFSNLEGPGGLLRFGIVMAGKISILIEQLIALRTKGDRGMVAPLKIKLIMKGVDPDMYNASTPDNPIVIQRVIAIAKEMGYDLTLQ